jgi:chemotaxis protein MotB
MARGKAFRAYSPGRRGGRRRGDNEDDSNRWLGTYGDAVTLLMAFFVMLYAMSQIDQVKFEAFVEGLRVPFGNASSIEMLDGQPAIVGDAGAETPSVEPGAVTNPGPDPLEPQPVAPIVPMRPDQADDPASEPPAQDLEQLRDVQKQIAASLDAEGLSGVAELELDHRGLVVSISADEVLFATGSTEISELGRQVIRAVATPLQATENDLVIEGHTDNVPLRRGGYTNWNLSTDRAVAVLSTLYSDVGIDQRRLGAAGYGEFRPRQPNTSPENRSINRRVDILIAAQIQE